MGSVPTGVGAAIAPAATAALKLRAGGGSGGGEADGDRRLRNNTVACPNLGNGLSKLSSMGLEINNINNNNSKPKIVSGEFGYTLEDVPHLSDYISHLPVRLSLSLSLFIRLLDLFLRFKKKKTLFLFLSDIFPLILAYFYMLV